MGWRIVDMVRHPREAVDAKQIYPDLREGKRDEKA
jgi:hypothetical protein